MEKEKNTDPFLDDLFDQARQAEPIMSYAEAEILIRNAPKKDSKEKKNDSFRKNLIRSIGLIIFFLFMYGVFRFFNDTKKEFVAPAIKNTEKKIVSNPEKLPEPNKEIIEKSPVQEKTNTSFPPVYKEENISRPEGIVLPEKKTIPVIPEKSITKTDGAATITFNREEKKIKMILYFGEVKDLFIDGIRINPANYHEYSNVIDEGKNLEKTGREEKEETDGLSDLEREQKRQNELIMNTIMKVLAKDQLITDGQSFDFRLMWNKLVIDGNEQPKELYEKYRALYEEVSGKRLTEKSNIHIRH
jgi:hypothetical protein